MLPLPVEASSAIHAIHDIKQQFWKAGRWAIFSTEDDQEKYADLAKALERDPQKQTSEVISLDYANDTRLTDIPQQGPYDLKRVVITSSYSNRDRRQTNRRDKVVLQLYLYVLQVLGNQLDRRFAIGMLLCGYGFVIKIKVSSVRWN